MSDVPRLIGWRTSNYIYETSDIEIAKNWEAHNEILPIFEGDPYTKLTSPKRELENIGEEWKPCQKLPVVVHVREQRPGENHVSTREGITPIKPDDLIMRGIEGEEYPIGRELFQKTYKLLSE